MSSPATAGRITGTPSDVGLELHEQVVAHHPAVDLELGELDPRVLVHGVEHLTGLPACRLERRPGEVALVDVPGEPGEHAAGV